MGRCRNKLAESQFMTDVECMRGDVKVGAEVYGVILVVTFKYKVKLAAPDNFMWIEDAQIK